MTSKVDDCSSLPLLLSFHGEVARVTAIADPVQDLAEVLPLGELHTKKISFNLSTYAA